MAAPARLPSGRAVVGGLLVMAAAVGAVTLARSAGEPETVPVVVARSPIEPGAPFDGENLEVTNLALPDAVVEGTFADPTALSGTVSRSYLDAGEILQQGDVVAATAAQRAAAPAREVALRLELDRAVDGRIEAGDRIDVLATYGKGIEATTLVILADAHVLAVERLDGGISTSRSIVITLALDDRAETVALAHAVDNAAVTVVRTTTAGSDDWSQPYRPETPTTLAGAESS